VFIVRNKDQECNNPLSKFRNLPLQAKDRTWSELRTCAKRFGGLEVTTLPWWASRSFIRPCLHAELWGT